MLKLLPTAFKSSNLFSQKKLLLPFFPFCIHLCTCLRTRIPGPLYVKILYLRVPHL